jgi:secondary thiamine-phosphate synthase enzyme
MALQTFSLETTGNGLVDITERVRESVRDSGVVEGIAVLWTPHTTAALSVVSFPDPKGLEDVADEIDRLIPTRIDFKHQHDTPQDAAGHVKSAIVGVSLSMIVDGGDVVLGHSQKIYLFEFDGPRTRSVHVRTMA